MLKPSLSLGVLVFAALAVNSADAQRPRSASVTPVPIRANISMAIDDPTIVAIFDAANTWDVETADLALQKSQDKDVRAFAATMKRDHAAVRQLGRDLAHKLNVTPTPPGKDFPLYQAHLAAMKTLNAAQGTAFDKAYIDHEVAYHQAVIDAMTKQLIPATKNAELKALELKVAPNFEAHLAAAKKLQQQLNSR